LCATHVMARRFHALINILRLHVYASHDVHMAPGVHSQAGTGSTHPPLVNGTNIVRAVSDFHRLHALFGRSMRVVSQRRLTVLTGVFGCCA
jgi:hypothetical protein